MTTGARRGEVCAIRWSAVNLDAGRETIWLRHGVREDGRGGWEEATLKTHQQRRIALDTETAAALVAHRRRCEQRAASLGVTLQPDAFVFSDRADPRHPYERVAADLAGRVESGELAAGAPAPTAGVLAAEHGVSLATARRAIALAKEWGLLVMDGASRPRVGVRDGVALAADAAPAQSQVGPAGQYWSVVVSGPIGLRCKPRTVKGDIADPDAFRAHLVGIVKAEDPLSARCPRTRGSATTSCMFVVQVPPRPKRSSG